MSSTMSTCFLFWGSKLQMLSFKQLLVWDFLGNCESLNTGYRFDDLIQALGPEQSQSLESWRLWFLVQIRSRRGRGIYYSIYEDQYLRQKEGHRGPTGCRSLAKSETAYSKQIDRMFGISYGAFFISRQVRRHHFGCKHALASQPWNQVITKKIILQYTCLTIAQNLVNTRVSVKKPSIQDDSNRSGTGHKVLCLPTTCCLRDICSVRCYR